MRHRDELNGRQVEDGMGFAGLAAAPRERAREVYEATRDKIAATRERQLADALATLRDAREKLTLYRAAHSGEYLGGVEYTELMRRIDQILGPRT